MNFGRVGNLQTNADWEKLIANLPTEARMWEHIDPSRNGGDPTVKQGWRLTVIPSVKFRLPRGAEVTLIPESPIGPYTLVRVGRTAMNLRNGLKVIGGVIVGDVHVCARIFWPRGADERPASDRPAWRNYLLFLDVYPTSQETAKYDLKIHLEGINRTPLVILGGEQDGNVCWATRSANWKPSRDGAGSDQCLVFYPHE